MYSSKEKQREASRRWREKNLERSNELARNAQRRYRAEDPEKFRKRATEWTRRWRANNREKARAYNREYYRANKEKIREKTKIKRVARGDIGNGTKLGWASKVLCYTKRLSERRGHVAPSVKKEDVARMWESQGGKCFWFGVPMNKTPRSHWKVSLDRLDNNKGYTPDNVVLCTWMANRARNAMSVEEFREALCVLRTALGGSQVNF